MGFMNADFIFFPVMKKKDCSQCFAVNVFTNLFWSQFIGGLA